MVDKWSIISTQWPPCIDMVDMDMVDMDMLNMDMVDMDMADMDMDMADMDMVDICLLYTSPSPRDKRQSRMPSSA